MIVKTDLSFQKKCQNIFFSTLNFFQKYHTKYPNILQNIQLTVIYSFAVIDLIYSILANVFNFGYFPELLTPFFPFIRVILVSNIFRMWTSPEKVFLLSYLVIEFIIVKSIFNFSKLVKYNILFIFALIMLQGLALSYWDLLFHRTIAAPVAKWSYDQGALAFSDKPLGVFFFFSTFIVFLLVYIYLYIRAIQGKFATVPGIEWITDSVAFWLRIKTPTMRFGKRKNK